MCARRAINTCVCVKIHIKFQFDSEQFSRKKIQGHYRLQPETPLSLTKPVHLLDTRINTTDACVSWLTIYMKRSSRPR